jgi:subtilisin-like proprotein convertase family protein/subtilisin family serine protease
MRIPLGRRFDSLPLEARLAPGDWLFTNLLDAPALPAPAEPAPAIAPAFVEWQPQPTAEFDGSSATSDREEPIREAEGPAFETVRVEAVDDLTMPVLFAPASVRSAKEESADATVPVFESAASNAEAIASVDPATVEPIPAASPSFARASFVGPARLVKPDSANVPEMAFTSTEVMIGIAAAKADALAMLQSSPLGDRFDIAASEVILEHDGVSLTKAVLRDGESVTETVAAVQAQPWAAWAEPNYFVVGDARDLTPNDASFGNAGQYFHTLAQHNLAWDVQTGDSSVIVAVTDDGVGYNHTDLAPNIWSNSKEATGTAGVDDDGNGRIDDFRGWDFSGGDNNPLPAGTSTHGTHVAGIIAARTNNLVGVAGTAGGNNATPGISIMPVRWDGTTSWTASVVANSFAYASGNGAKIISSSYNFDGFAGNNTVVTAFNSSYSKGVLHFNSSGNSGALDPARRTFDQTLFVGSQDSANVRSSFSNYGSFVDVTGNGSGIYSTTTASDGTTVTYSTLSGTSMSTPHAAGVAALIWSQNPTWTRDQVAAQLLATADVVDSATPANIFQQGSGRVNAYRGVTEAIAAPRFGRVTGLPANGAGTTTSFASFAIETTMRLDPASVVPGNFELRNAGADNAFDTGDDSTVTLVINAGAAYRMGTNELTFTKSGGGNFANGRYRFTAFSDATKLRDPFQQALDGDTDGAAGGNFLREFTIGNGAASISGTIYEDRNGNGTREAFDAALTGTTQPTVYLDRNNNGSRDSVVTTFTSGGPVAIPAMGRVFVPVTVSGLTAAATDVDVKLNITHPRLSDLDLFLIGPNGIRVELATDVGASGANMVNTVLNDAAATAVTAGTAPFTNSYRPEIPLSYFNNHSANGGWLLEVVDDNPAAIAGTTQVDSVSLLVTTPEESATPDAAGSYAFAGLPAGDYTVRTIAASGWVVTGPATATVPATGGASGIDLGTAKNGRVYSRVYNDANDNATWDSGETGIVGRNLFIDTNGNGTLDKTASSYANPNVLAIPDAGAKVFSDITVSDLTGLTAVDVNVTINVTHPYLADLNIYLVSPAGTRVELVTAVGGSNDNFTNTTFDDEATTAIGSGTAPYTGSFRPEGLLSAVDGQTLNGTWRLEIQDVASQDIGQLNSWSLNLQYGSGANDPWVATDTNGNASIDLAAGSYDFHNATVAGWRPTNPVSSNYAVTVAGAPVYDRAFGTVADATAPTLASSRVGSFANPNQRSRVDRVTLTMSERVTFTGTPGDAVSVSQVGGGSVAATVVADNSGPATVLTVTFTDTVVNGSLVDGDYAIALDGTQIRDLAQNAMGGTSTVNFHRLFGDGNGDRSVNGTDYSQFRFTFGSTTGDANFNAAFDANNDGSINGTDFTQFRTRFGSSLP